VPVAVSLLLACARPPAVAPEPPLGRPALWVDASAREGGDGTRERPVRSLPRELPADTDVHVRTGLYEGPFVLGDGASLEGHGEVVLHAGPDGALLRAGNGAVRGVSLQGGAVGLEATGALSLERARLSGQRQQAATITGSVRARDLEVVGVVEGIDGLVVSGALELDRARFTGGLKRAVRVLEGGRALVRASTSEGPKTFVHALSARVALKDGAARGGSSAAVFISGGELAVDDLDVTGHEYALQAVRGARVTAKGLRSTGALDAAVSVIEVTLELRDAQLAHTGPGGAVSAQQSTTTLEDVSVRDATHLGFFVKQGSARLARCAVERVSADGVSQGDAVMARDARVTIEGLRVADVEGSALFASAFAEVSVRRLEVERAAASAFFVERGATVRGGDVLVRGGRGPAVLVPDAATVELEGLSVASGEVPIYAECDLGARVTVRRLESTQPQPQSRCVSLAER
jgi:hypothetical protein